MKKTETTMGERLKMARELAGLSQSQVAQLLGTSTTVISSAENNRSVMSQKFVNLFLDEVGSNREWLTEGKGEIGNIPLWDTRPINKFSKDPWRDALVSDLKSQVEYLKEMLKISMQGKHANFLKTLENASTKVIPLVVSGASSRKVA